MYFDDQNIEKIGILESFKNSVGVMLSYGEASDVIPVGVFEVSQFIDASKRPYKVGISSLDATLVELVKVNEKTTFSNSNCEKIYIPLKSFIEIYPTSIASENSSRFHYDFGMEAYIESLLALDKSLSKRLEKLDLINENGEISLEDISNNSIYESGFKTLEDIGAIYVNAQNEVMGNNYSIMPYSLGKVLRKTLVKTMDPPEKEERSYGRSR